MLIEPGSPKRPKATSAAPPHISLRRKPRLERARAVARTASAVQLALAKQRKQWAQDLHDGLGGPLSALAHSADAQTAALAAQAMGSMRALLASFSAAEHRFADQFADVRAALAAQCELSGIEFHCESACLDGLAASALGPRCGKELLNILREAACNAIKHSGCTNLCLGVSLRGHQLRFCLADDGKGFDVHATPKQAAGHGLGLAGMRERAKRIDAKIDLLSLAGRGSTLSLRLPLGLSDLTAP